MEERGSSQIMPILGRPSYGSVFVFEGASQICVRIALPDYGFHRSPGYVRRFSSSGYVAR